MGLRDWFGPRNRSLVGVDIGSSAVKLVSIEKSGSSYTAQSVGRVELVEDTIVDGAIISKLPLADSIEALYATHKIRNNRIATSISGHSVIVKKVTLPVLTEQELDESIQWEAEQYIPFDLTEVNVDYQIIRKVPEEQKLEVILVAAKKEKIADYTSVISMAGKTAVVVDIDAFALQNVYEVNYDPEPTTVAAILNIGANSMNVNIVKGNEFLFTRDIATGGSQYTEFIQKDLGISFEVAENYKLGIDVPSKMSDRITAIMHSVSENLALEIEKTFDFFKTTTYSDDIEILYICGGASKTAGLKTYLSENFNFTVEFLDPFKKVSLPKDVDPRTDSQEPAVDYSVAVGLALRTGQD